MKNSKEKWKLEPLVKKVCLVTTIYYSVIIALAGLIYLSMFLFSFSVVGDVLFSILCWVHIFFYWTKVIYIPPIIITMFLLSVAFTELVKRKNPRVFVHPLVLSSIASSVPTCNAFACGKVPSSAPTTNTVSNSNPFAV